MRFGDNEKENKCNFSVLFERESLVCERIENKKALYLKV